MSLGLVSHYDFNSRLPSRQRFCTTDLSALDTPLSRYTVDVETTFPRQIVYIRWNNYLPKGRI